MEQNSVGRLALGDSLCGFHGSNLDCFAASNDLQHGTTPTLNITVSFSGKYSLNLTRFPPWKRHDLHHKETSGKRSLWLIKSPPILLPGFIQEMRLHSITFNDSCVHLKKKLMYKRPVIQIFIFKKPGNFFKYTSHFVVGDSKVTLFIVLNGV